MSRVTFVCVCVSMYLHLCVCVGIRVFFFLYRVLESTCFLFLFSKATSKLHEVEKKRGVKDTVDVKQQARSSEECLVTQQLKKKKTWNPKGREERCTRQRSSLPSFTSSNA